MLGGMDAAKRILLVGVGGFLGANARYWISLALATSYPWTTMGINVVGSFLLGSIVGLDPAPGWKLFLGVGVMGGFTTFSAFSVESLALVEAGEWRRAGVYVFGSVLLSLFAAGGGLALARSVASR